MRQADEILRTASAYFAMAEPEDPALKDRIDGLRAIRDQAKADAERAQAMPDTSGSKAITPQMVRTFARTVRQRIRLEREGYRQDHLRALAQRVEVAAGEVRIIGSKSRLLQTLVANGSPNVVPTRGLNWRATPDSDDHYEFAIVF
jgi:hypothetical protein